VVVVNIAVAVVNIAVVEDEGAFSTAIGGTTPTDGPVGVYKDKDGVL